MKFTLSSKQRLWPIAAYTDLFGVLAHVFTTTVLVVAIVQKITYPIVFEETHCWSSASAIAMSETLRDRDPFT